MPLYRPHRASLEDSIKETVLVSDVPHLCNVLMKDLNSWGNFIINVDDLIIEPYPTIERCFDKRIGWHTQIITVNPDSNFPPLGVLGFLSEPFIQGTPSDIYYQLWLYKSSLLKIRNCLLPDLRNSEWKDDYHHWMEKIKQVKVIVEDYILKCKKEEEF